MGKKLKLGQSIAWQADSSGWGAYDREEPKPRVQVSPREDTTSSWEAWESANVGSSSSNWGGGDVWSNAEATAPAPTEENYPSLSGRREPEYNTPSPPPNDSIPGYAGLFSQGNSSSSASSSGFRTNNSRSQSGRRKERVNTSATQSLRNIFSIEEPDFTPSPSTRQTNPYTSSTNINKPVGGKVSFVPPSVTTPLAVTAPNNTDQQLLGMLREPKQVNQPAPMTPPPLKTTPSKSISDKSPSTQIKQMVGAGSGPAPTSSGEKNIYNELLKQLVELDRREANKGKPKVYVIQNNSIKVTVDLT